MRIGYLIGALGRGGSERQLVQLAAGMARRGHEVEIACYDGAGALDGAAEEGGARVRRMAGGSKLAKLAAVRAWAREAQPEVLHGFMKRASTLAVLADLPGRRRRVVASDLSTATYARRQPALWGALAAFSLADVVVTQTETNRRSLGRLAPWLRRRTLVVRNGVDTARFRPAAPPQPEPFRFACVGTVYRVKNPVRVVEAVAALRHLTPRPFRLDWFGRLGLGGDAAPSAEHAEALAAADRLGVADVVAFRGETARVEVACHGAHALVHASLQEGIPNAVVEAMACGLPIVVSRVSDLPLLVAEAANGCVCDELDPASIAAAMLRLPETPAAERAAMSGRSRELAVRWFGMERFVDEYEALYLRLLGRA